MGRASRDDRLRRKDRRTIPVAVPPPRGTLLAFAVVLPIAVGIVTYASFLPALRAEFVNFDDDKLFTKNKNYRGFSAEHLHWMFTTTFMGHYQPLTWLSSALDYRISGNEPLSYHRNSMILHAAGAVALYFIALRLLSAGVQRSIAEHPIAMRLAAAAAALLFGVHPLRVESVAWASERRDVLSGALLLLALLQYLRSVEPQRSDLRSWSAYAASLVLLGLSLLAKAWGMSFFLIAILLDFYPLRRLTLNRQSSLNAGTARVLLQKVPYVVLGLMAAVKAGSAQRAALDTMLSLSEWSVTNRIVQAFYGLAFYVRKTVWPTHLAALYEIPHHFHPFAWPHLVSIVSVLVAALLVLRLRRRCPALVVAAITYAITVAPVLGFAQSGPQFVADRYSYLSCIPWALLAAAGLLLLVANRSTVWTAAVFVVAVGVFAVLFVATYRQTQVWQNSKTLWKHALDVGVESSIAHLNYGVVLRGEGRTEEGLAHYQRAVALQPTNGEAWFSLGNAWKAVRRYTESEHAYREAIKHMTRKPDAYLNLGNLYRVELGRLDDAIEAYRAAATYAETHRPKLWTPRPYLALGIALRQKGAIVEARVALEKAARYPETRSAALAELARLPR